MTSIFRSKQPLKPVPIAVSSRGIGYHTAEFYSSLKSKIEDEKDSLPSINAVYRVGLYCFEAKVRSQGGCLFDHTEKSKYPSTFFLRAKVVAGLPPFVQYIIDNIECVDIKSVLHVPVIAEMPKMPAHPDGADILHPQPERVCLSNLREVVEALSSTNTPVEWRHHYFWGNCIPGLMIQDNVLLNPGDVIPANYDEKSLIADIREVGGLVRLMKKYDYKPTLPTNAKKGRALMLSYFFRGTILKPWEPNMDLDDYYDDIFIESEKRTSIKDYWSTEDLSDEEVKVGIRTWLGEVSEDKMNPLYAKRLPEACGFHFHYD